MTKLFADTRPLQSPAFRRLWLANIVTVIGGQMTVVAVPAQIYSITKDSGYVGLTGLFGLVPLIVFGLYGGAIADAFDKRRVLLATTLGLIGTTALFWVLTVLGNTNVWLLLGTYSLQQAFFAVNQPTRTALMPRLLPKGLLAAAAALNMTLVQFGAIVGPLLAGALIPITGFAWLYAIDALSLMSTLWAVVKLPAVPGGGPGPGVASVVAGVKYAATQPILLISLVADLIAMVFGLPRALYPEIAHVSFGGPASGGTILALLYASMALGAVLGGLFSGWISTVTRQGVAVYVLIIAWGLAVIGAGIGVLSHLAWLCLVMLVLGGMMDMFSMAFRSAILQESADEHVQGRIQGIFLIVVAGGPRFGDLLHGYSSGLIGPAYTIISGGVLVILGTLVCMVLAPSFWNYRRPCSLESST